MVQQPIEVYSDATNQAVVRMPGRRFPGLVLQGDSVRQLLELAREAESRAGNFGRDGAAEADDLTSSTLGMLRERIQSYLSAYEQTLPEHGIELPYEK